MRQHPLLRWIEQAEARRTSDAALFDQTIYLSIEPKEQDDATTAPRTSRLLRPLLRRLRPFRTVSDLC